MTVFVPGIDEVTVSTDGTVALVTINRPEKLNSVTPPMSAALESFAHWANDSDDVRAVVLTGAGDKAFCAGADLSAGSGSFKYDYSKVGLAFVKLMKQARDLTLPLIARVNGHAMAGGMGMLGM